MDFNSQKEPIEQLKLLASSNRQSVLIEGVAGSGKSYLSRQYASMINADDYVTVLPKVADVREAVDSCISEGAGVKLLCIENLDLGVPAASYALLKFLEEPIEGVYIVVTCRDRSKVPDTIISRSAVVTLQPPIRSDLDMYAQSRDLAKYNQVCTRMVWKCCQSFADADAILAMSPSQLDYYDGLRNICKFTDTISNLVWAISHYDSNSASNVELSIRCIMEYMHTPFIVRSGIDCIKDLNSGRIASHAVLSRFMLNCKYCE